MEFRRPKFPRRDELLAARNRVIERHSETTFIGAHMANNPEDLSDRCHAGWTRIQISTSKSLPASANWDGNHTRLVSFLTKYADRVLFGTDGPWPESATATVLAIPGDVGRVLSVLRKGVSTARILEHLRRRVAGRCACAASTMAMRPSSIPGVQPAADSTRPELQLPRMKAAAVGRGTQRGARPSAQSAKPSWR